MTITRAEQPAPKPEVSQVLHDLGLAREPGVGRAFQISAFYNAWRYLVWVGLDPLLMSAMRGLLPHLDDDVRARAEARLDEADAAAPPFSSKRVVLAAVPRYVELRRAALDALGAAVGDLAPGVFRLGSDGLSEESTRELSAMVRELDVEAMYPSRGNVPRMARQAGAAVYAATEEQVRRGVFDDRSAQRMLALASEARRACRSLAQFVEGTELLRGRAR